MRCWVGLLRAVNVGGTGKLPMAELRAMCEEIGFGQVRTYIASGNVVFTGDAEIDEADVKQKLENRLERFAGKRIDIMVRSDSEIEQVLRDNPFRNEAGDRIGVLFADEPPPPDVIGRATGLKNERIQLGRREIYIHYPDGMGQSKLKLPSIGPATNRNLNTVRKLGEMTRETELS